MENISVSIRSISKYVYGWHKHSKRARLALHECMGRKIVRPDGFCFKSVAEITMVTAGHTSWFIYVRFATLTLNTFEKKKTKNKGNSAHSLLSHSFSLSISLSHTLSSASGCARLCYSYSILNVVYFLVLYFTLECCVAMWLRYLAGFQLSCLCCLYSPQQCYSHTKKLNIGIIFVGGKYRRSSRLDTP